MNRYSERKFRELSPDRRIRAIERMLEAYEGCFGKPGELVELSEEISKCFSWLKPDVMNPFPEIMRLISAGAGYYPIAKAISEYFQAKGRIYKDSQMPVITGDGTRIADPRLKERGAKLVIILDDLRSVFNVGSIFRTSECLALSKLYLCGTTPTPEHPNMSKTAMGTSELVPWVYKSKTADAIRECRDHGYRVLALETTKDAVSVFTESFDLPLALVLGNESLGISPEVLEICDGFVDIPVLGWKNSLNVGVAFAIAAYQIVCGQNGVE